jgi:CDP-diacylglycerol--glycerol-3-phosphate 3-phosphatidyltransferase
MQMGYWAIGPVSRVCILAGLSANAISWASLVFGAGAGLALAFGHMGVGAIVGVVSFGCDALDGMVARARGTASRSGEVLDAAVDRYVELFFLGGIAFHLRANAFGLVLALGAITGAIMMSYATAKAEALHVEAPRGSMRRQERAVYLALGAALTPLTALAVRFRLPLSIAPVPLLLALALVGVAGNASAVRRLWATARSVRVQNPGTCKRGRSGLAETSKPYAGDSHVIAGDGLR